MLQHVAGVGDDLVQKLKRHRGGFPLVLTDPEDALSYFVIAGTRP